MLPLLEASVAITARPPGGLSSQAGKQCREGGGSLADIVLSVELLHNSNMVVISAERTQGEAERG